MKKTSSLEPTAKHSNQSTGIIKHSISRDKWQAHLEDWLSVGMSLRQYCIRRHLSEKQAYYWRSKLMPRLSQQKNKAAQKSKCVPVVVKAASAQVEVKPFPAEPAVLYCIIDLGHGKQVRIVNAVAYKQLLERLLGHATIV